MLILSDETEKLAKKLASLEGIKVDLAVQAAILARYIETNKFSDLPGKRDDRSGARRDAQRLLNVGGEIADLPLLDARSPQEIIDDIHAL